MKLSSLSILIPAYKDEKTITSVIRRAQHVGKQIANVWEIVVINDASPDSTGKEINKLKKHIPELRFIEHACNKGYGGTIKELYYAGKYTWSFTVPGDYQMDPAEIKKLIPYTKNADMIIGWRSDRKDSLARKRQSAIYNGLLRFLYGLYLHDINSIRLMKRTILQKRHIDSVSAFVDAELTIGAIRDGFRVIEIPIEHRKRETSGASGGKPSVIIPVIRDMLLYKLRHLL